MYSGTHKRRDDNPKGKAGILSTITFLFTFDVFKKSADHELTEKDVYNVLPDYRSSKLGDAIEKEWEYEKTRPKIKLSRLLFRMFGKEYMMYGLVNLIIKTTVMSVQPVATGKLVSYFSEGSKVTESEAYYYAAVIVGATLISVFFNHTYMLCLSQLGLRLRVALCSLMYRKSLKLTTSSLTRFNNGRIVTMMTKNVMVFEKALAFMHDLWIGFIRVSVMMYIIYKQIEWSAFVGMAVLLVLLPIQCGMSYLTKKFSLKSAAATDERLRKIQEILNSIKLIKLYTWENYFSKITNMLREKEMKRVRTIFNIYSTILCLSMISQRFSFYSCIMVYIALGNVITAEKVFIIMGCYTSIRFVLSVSIPFSFSQIAECKSSLKRIKEYLLVEDIDDIKKFKLDVIKSSIILKDITVEIQDRTVLRNINFETNHSFIGITGPVGSGKSTLLRVMLEDIQITEGTVNTAGIVSYASQEPWLFPATVKQNILFGQPYQKERYETVVRITSLLRDISSFPDKDNTLVSDQGLNLSKGQRARINLARAVYKKADIYLLDDVLSALDASVGKHVFEECFKNFLKGKLVVAVCHNKKFLKSMDRIIVLDDNTIIADGTFDVLETQGVDFGKNVSLESEISTEETKSLPEKEANTESDAGEKSKLLVSVDKDLDNTELYGEEKKEGKVDFDMYLQYLKYCGGWKFVPLYLLIAVFYQAANSYFDVYITKWIRIEETLTKLRKTNQSSLEYEEALDDHNMAIFIYTMLIFIVITITVMKTFGFYWLATRGSRKMHGIVFSKVIAAKMTFFDTNLSGNVLNRFSKDFAVIDESLPYSYMECLRVFLFLVGSIGVISSVIYGISIPTFFIILIMLYMRNVYMKTSRSLKRLEASTRAPIVGYLNSSLEGLTTIRASGTERILIDQFDGHQDLNTSTCHIVLCTSRAFGFYVDILCGLFVSGITLGFIFFDPQDVFSGNVGLALTQAFGLTRMLQWGFRQWAEVENLMTSVERVLEYSRIESESTAGISPEGWPEKGRIQYNNVYLKYQNSEKAILKDLNFDVEPTQKIGIIGRTGAGKSSIISTLFKMYDIDGSVYIDGEDIKRIQVKTLRSKISIIPQDPLLFSGTIRMNLDPHEQYSDSKLWSALGEVNLKAEVESLPNGLETVITENGSNFSMGQRQLVCLARAILRNNKILVLDEATANIDPQTDALLQQTIKRVFKDCTILTIAHRLNTVMDSDKIMVIDAGSIVEFDSPKNLLDKRSGFFYKLAQQSDLVK